MSDTTGSNLEKYESAVLQPEYQAKVEHLVRELPTWAEIPPVLASDMKQVWEASRRINQDIPPRPGHQIGAGVFADYGVDAAAEPVRFMATTMRHAILFGIVERGALKEYLHGSEPSESVFKAMAIIPCTREDWARAMFPQWLNQLPFDGAETLKETIKAHGQDPEKPSVDARFIQFLRDECDST